VGKTDKQAVSLTYST